MFDYHKAFSRNLGLTTPEEQERLRHATVAIPGMGGVGGIHLATLARMGIGGFHVADGDKFELANFNRQYGAFVSTINKDKVQVMERFAKDINPELRLKVFKHYLEPEHLDAFLDGCDLVVDSLDAFAIDIRRALCMRAYQKGIPVVGTGPIGFSTSMVIYLSEAMSMDTYMGLTDRMSYEEKIVRFLVGITPTLDAFKYMNKDLIDPEQRRGPCISSAVTLCAGFAATEVFKLLLERKEVKAAPYYHYFDPYIMKFKTGYIPFGNQNPLQRLKIHLLKKAIFK